VTLRRKDIANLLETAGNLSDCIDLENVKERFTQLESKVVERDQYYSDMMNSWKVFKEKKNRFRNILNASSLVNSLMKCKTLQDVEQDVIEIDVSLRTFSFLLTSLCVCMIDISSYNILKKTVHKL
jgi:hypothetical protein